MEIQLINFDNIHTPASSTQNKNLYNELTQLLDKGIDDMEAGRELPIDEAFELISELVEKRKNESK